MFFKDLNNKKWRLLKQEDKINIKKIETIGEKLGNVVLELMKDQTKLNQFSENIKILAKTNAANDIVNTITSEIQKS